MLYLKTHPTAVILTTNSISFSSFLIYSFHFLLFHCFSYFFFFFLSPFILFLFSLHFFVRLGGTYSTRAYRPTLNSYRYVRTNSKYIPILLYILIFLKKLSYQHQRWMTSSEVPCSGMSNWILSLRSMILVLINPTTLQYCVYRILFNRMFPKDTVKRLQ